MKRSCTTPLSVEHIAATKRIRTEGTGTGAPPGQVPGPGTRTCAKRQRIVDVSCDTALPPVALPLEKSMYSKQEVQQLLETVESQYTHQMEAYYEYIRIMLPPNHKHQMAYIS